MADSRAPLGSTFLASQEAASIEEVRGLAAALLENPVANAILDAVSGFALILNRGRQVVAVNHELMEELGVTSAETLHGLRVGEILHCIKVQEVTGGFGVPQACSHCGNALAVLASLELEGHEVPAPLPIPAARNLRHSGAFQVRSTPVRLGGHDLLVFTLQNISGQQRREALEQVFFHDILNLVEGLDGIATRILDQPGSASSSAGQIRDLSCQLSEEIQNQRILLSAEEGGLVTDTRDTRPSEILDKVGRVFSHHEVADGRHLVFGHGPAGTFPTDPVLLTRVLVNLVKNALEATPKGETVKVWHEWREGQRGFLVENPGCIPPAVAERVFERSHSTKASRGRGLGTYSARLLGERFLGGRVAFTSPPGGPTRFEVWIPDRGPAPRFPGELEESVFRTPQPSWGEAAPGAGLEGADTVLIIDDSHTVRSLLETILGRHYRTLLAQTGEEGLALALERSPDLILLDVMMPGLDGFAVCSRLKADSRTREIPVLFLTALSGEGDEMKALEAGGIDFIPKPISPAVLCARVRNHLELKHTQDRLRNLSLLDGLTGIANRRNFDQYLDLEWQRCTRNGHPLSVVLGDVDFFKDYNDHFGHGQGDECLRKVAAVFDQALRRPGDLAARYGGEEFVCILPETDHEGARIVADQIMAGMACLQLPHPCSGIADLVTVSVGVATVLRPLPGEAWMHLVEAADRFMYQAKAKGRNRIETG
jgi:diguanylate cyclase (GGDEF)-like protein